MASILDKTIDEMGKRCALATPKPWRGEIGFQGSTHVLFLVRPEQDGVFFGKRPQDADDIVFAAHARTDLPRALAALRAAVEFIAAVGEDAQAENDVPTMAACNVAIRIIEEKLEEGNS